MAEDQAIPESILIIGAGVFGRKLLFSFHILIFFYFFGLQKLVVICMRSNLKTKV